MHQAPPLRADFALLHAERPIAVVEVKKSSRDVRRGVQQARRYAERLDVPLAYATNGQRLIEIDMRAQIEHEVQAFQSPEKAWTHYRNANELTSDLAVAFAETRYSRRVVDAAGNPKKLRYYQDVAVQRLIRGIASDKKRLLAVLATGAGKTNVAMQLVHVLWENRWPRGVDSTDSRPRVLYLADRDILVNQPMRDWFRPAFGEEPITRVTTSSPRSKHLYFALYQALDQVGDGTDRLFRQYDPEWFDLVIVDECHRGSAKENSAWREVLEHFSSAVQVGLTATPVSQGHADTYGYFGPPIVEYSLRQGIEDGFLAPFQVVRVHLDSDIDGIEITEGTLDAVTGELVPAGIYKLGRLERELVVPARTEEAANYLTDLMRRTDRLGKTIVFCVDQAHAARFREAMVNRNSDMMQTHNDWVVRITSDEGELGKVLLDRFQQPETAVPVVVTTSRLLSTGVDVPTVKNIVLFTAIKSMPQFKQTIGRGTRLDADNGKEFFTIIDFTGATRLFDDPTFDGPPIRRSVVNYGDPIPAEATEPAELDAAFDDDSPRSTVEQDAANDDATDVDDDEVPADVTDPDHIDAVRRRSTVYTVDGIDVRVASEGVYVVDRETGNLRLIRFEQWVRNRMLALELDRESLLAQWATVSGRKALREALEEELGIGIDGLVARLNRPDCDPIDLLIHLAWDEPLKTRRERANRLTRGERAFLSTYAAEARQVLAVLVDKYSANGPDDLDAKVLVLPPFRDMGTPAQLAARFGGVDQLREALDDLGQQLFKSTA
ncbi:type I restriction enzyme R subunit [Micromonospora ureilytica]|uniref:Type I restriction enzyme R subunit n=1 Tax=Micromonospora ureilytica TaxID=709868 RepID=A0ABS0JR02_9ACTN|nr:DEAD/DEAH box helicase family protein [Micromonospora ureilytica]MBG6069468.1 type I restriction enzyme R subunit [Micromonospora ureilytica]